MARSFKKNPVYTDGRNGQVKTKRAANKVVRKYKHKLSNGKSYKRLFSSWNIHDYTMRWSWEEAKRDYENPSNYGYSKQEYPTLKEFYSFWSKYHKRK